MNTFTNRLRQLLPVAAVVIAQAAWPAGAETATYTGVLAHGVDLTFRDATGQTQLIMAALAGESANVQILLDAGADVMARTDKGMTALHAAAYVGDVDSMKLLIAHGADVNDQANIAGITPLSAAAEENYPEAVKLLLASGADLSRLEVNGYTAGSRAGWREHWDIVRVLLKAGDVCQPEAVAGAWLYDKCTHLDLNASN